MRPDILNPLFANAAKLPGIGPKLEKALGKLFGRGDELNPEPAKIIDLLFHVPSGMIDRRNRPTINQLPEFGIVTVEVEVGRHRTPPAHNKRVPYRVECFDDTGSLSLVFFHAMAITCKRPCRRAKPALCPAASNGSTACRRSFIPITS